MTNREEATLIQDTANILSMTEDSLKVMVNLIMEMDRTEEIKEKKAA